MYYIFLTDRNTFFQMRSICISHTDILTDSLNNFTFRMLRNRDQKKNELVLYASNILPQDIKENAATLGHCHFFQPLSIFSPHLLLLVALPFFSYLFSIATTFPNFLIPNTSSQTLSSSSSSLQLYIAFYVPILLQLYLLSCIILSYKDFRKNLSIHRSFRSC